MKERTVGRTALRVSELGFGCAPLGNLYVRVSESEAQAAVHAALRAGIRYFDTAPLYGHGYSEHRLGAALRDFERLPIVISTKVGCLLDPVSSGDVDGGLFVDVLPFRPRYDYSYDATLRSVEHSLQRLGVSHLDILLIHNLDAASHGSQNFEKVFADAMNGAYRAIIELRESGVVRAVGAGVNEWDAAERLASAGDFDCFLLASRYTLLRQDSLDTFLPLCGRRGISIIVGGPFNTGILATGAVPNARYEYGPPPADILATVKRIESICRDFAVPMPAAALQFPLFHPNVCAVIPGARSAAEVETNRRLYEVSIPPAFWFAMRDERLIRADAPICS